MKKIFLVFFTTTFFLFSNAQLTDTRKVNPNPVFTKSVDIKQTGTGDLILKTGKDISSPIEKPVVQTGFTIERN